MRAQRSTPNELADSHYRGRAGNRYISDYDHNRIRKVSNGIITTIAGSGMPAYRGCNGPTIEGGLEWSYRLRGGLPRQHLRLPHTQQSRSHPYVSTTPIITINGVVPVYSSVPTVQPGSWPAST
jgi:hypothetical protein